MENMPLSPIKKTDMSLVPLPDMPGPRLAPFKDGEAGEVEFLAPLGSGLHGSVFKARIDGEIYALKLVSICLSWLMLFPREF